MVTLTSTVCVCVPRSHKTISSKSTPQTQQQLTAAYKAANCKKEAFTNAERTNYLNALTRNVKRMNLGLSSYEKMINSLRRFIIGVSKWINGLFKRSPHVGGLGAMALKLLEWVFRISAYLLVFAAVSAILYGLFLLLRNVRHIQRRSTKTIVSAVIEPEANELGAVDELLSTADLLYKQGNHREALRHLYMASISLLTRAQIVTYSKDKTNRDYLRNLAKAQNPPALDAFRGITDIFDLIVYGGKNAAGTDYETARRHTVGLGESL